MPSSTWTTTAAAEAERALRARMFSPGVQEQVFSFHPAAWPARAIRHGPRLPPNRVTCFLDDVTPSRGSGPVKAALRRCRSSLEPLEQLRTHEQRNPVPAASDSTANHHASD
ncbi:hypothetical protein MTO96_047788 [Rhipicephalus appendiculatus]